MKEKRVGDAFCCQYYVISLYLMHGKYRKLNVDTVGFLFTTNGFALMSLISWYGYIYVMHRKKFFSILKNYALRIIRGFITTMMGWGDSVTPTKSVPHPSHPTPLGSLTQKSPRGLNFNVKMLL